MRFEARLWRNTFWVGATLSVMTVAANLFQSTSGGLMPPLKAEPTNTINAPEFPAGFSWHNVDKPLSIRGLRGKIVLLDFWTYGCINCMHILPDLKKLERKYPNELVIISVHSAKFENESDAANIRNAAMRYNIEHPIVVDQKMRLWSDYTVNVWPTLVLIDPAGKVHGSVAGEGNYKVLDENIAMLVQKFKANGGLNETPIKFALDAAKVAPTPLRYPGKVIADGQSGHLFIADSNHNRIVITKMDGTVEAVAGSGVVGNKDGAFDEATFSNPQGMALRRGPNNQLTLYVADTNNHSIRALDLNKGTVTTVAGTGRQAPWRSIGGVGTQAALASPWDLQLVRGVLYIAMAGPHQIWAMDVNTRRVGPYAGTGREARIDGTLKTSAFAQPSGLASDGRVLWVADSEISAIRQVDLPDTGTKVRTLAGGDLFDFGDRDGRGDQVRLQHPLGVVFHEGKVLLADTYNHKIKVLDPKTGAVQSFIGQGRGDKVGNAPQFYEPGGLSIAGDTLYVADTNNHKIKAINLKTKSTSVVALKGLPTALPAEPERTPEKVDLEANTIQLPPTVLAPNARGEMVLNIKLPAGHHLNDLSPQRVQMRIEGSGATIEKAIVTGKNVTLPLRVPLSAGATGKGSLVVSAAIFYCTDSAGVCKVGSLRLRAPFEIKEGGNTDLVLKAAI
ncbi:MAG: hypothetical protein JWN98_2726 [Abditibacteriota bacterium]|nr:hypothetical protein [Abditibacteriota bacterium]